MIKAEVRFVYGHLPSECMKAEFKGMPRRGETVVLHQNEDRLWIHMVEHYPTDVRDYDIWVLAKDHQPSHYREQ